MQYKAKNSFNNKYNKIMEISHFKKCQVLTNLKLNNQLDSQLELLREL
jgi:hypothetical protein